MTGTKLSPARRAILERRAAAARRRAVLTFSLFLTCVVVGVIAGTTALSWWFVLLPAAMMASVLVLGRRAVISQQRADAAYASRTQQVAYAPRPLSATEKKLAGRPVPAVRADSDSVPVENVSTTVISRVESSMFAKKHVTGRPTAPRLNSTQKSSEATNAHAAAPSSANSSSARAQSDDSARSTSIAHQQASPARKTVTQAAVRSAASAQSASGTRPTARAGQAWTSVPVPPPVYTAKAAAPRWEPPGITTELQQITKARMEEIAREAAERADVTARENAESEVVSEAVTHADASAQAQLPVSDEPIVSESTDSLGMSLNSILDRRRAV